MNIYIIIFPFFFVIFVIFLMERNYYNSCIKYIEDNNCDISLFKCIYDIISNIELPRIEISIKNSRLGRYTIPITFLVFDELSNSDKGKILNVIGFNYDDLDTIAFLKQGQSKSDIIFGVDNGVGKLYIDNSDIIYCIDTNGSTKTYIYHPEGKYYVVIRHSKDAEDERHYVVSNGLIATTTNTTNTKIQTIYKRPQIFGTILLEIIRLMRNKFTQ